MRYQRALSDPETIANSSSSGKQVSYAFQGVGSGMRVVEDGARIIAAPAFEVPDLIDAAHSDVTIGKAFWNGLWARLPSPTIDVHLNTNGMPNGLGVGVWPRVSNATNWFPFAHTNNMSNFIYTNIPWNNIGWPTNFNPGHASFWTP